LGDLLNHPTLFVLAIAVAAPLLAEIQVGLRVPTVVIEMAMGIVAGPHVLGWVFSAELASGQPLALLGKAGLAFLFFLVGMDLDVARFRGKPLTMGVASWGLSLAIAGTIVGLLFFNGFFKEPEMIAVALTTTSAGMLAPIFRDTGDANTDFGKLVLAAASMGEFGPILLIALLFTRIHSYPETAALMIFFMVVAIAMAVAAIRVHPVTVVKLFSRTLHMSSQLPVRICMLVMALLVILAGAIGIDATLGAFAAGMVVGPTMHGRDGNLMREKLDAIAFGYFVPFFFVTAGMRLDLSSLYGSLTGILLTPIFLAMMVVVRGAPVLLYRGLITREQRLPFALFLATELPLVVAITDIGVTTGKMRAVIAAALVAAAILSSLIFPTLADFLLHCSSAPRVGSSGSIELETKLAD